MYEEEFDRNSAYEILKKRNAEIEAKKEKALDEYGEYERHGSFRVPRSRTPSSGRRRRRPVSRRQTAGEAFTKSIMRALGSALGRSLGRMLGGR